MVEAGTIALFRRFPGLAGRLPRRALGRFPTPVERVALPELGELWVKRDDLTGPLYGGNKVRKLEFLLGDAARAGSRRLITAGALGSHHALATAVYGRAAGLAVTLVLFPQPVTPHVRRILLTDVDQGAELHYVPRMEWVPGALLARRWAARAEGGYVIPPGGSNPLGALGYVSAGLELGEQVRTGAVPAPAEIHVAAGTLGTAAGLAVGLALAGLDARVVATRITSRLVANEPALGRLVRGTLALLAPAVSLDARAVLARVELRHDQIGRGYGRETPAGAEATALFARVGLRLDPTYTAKAAAQAVAALRQGRTPLFWHTLSAGEPALQLGEAELIARLPERFRRSLEAG